VLKKTRKEDKIRNYTGSNLGLNFINVLRTAFSLVDPESVKNTVKSSVSFYTFGICACKSCTKNVDEIEPRSRKRKISVKSSSVSFFDFGIRARKMSMKLTLGEAEVS